MPDEIDDEEAYAAWCKLKTKVLAPKKTRLKQCKDAKTNAETSLADNNKLLENKQSELAALQIQLQNIEEWLAFSYKSFPYTQYRIIRKKNNSRQHVHWTVRWSHVGNRVERKWCKNSSSSSAIYQSQPIDN